MSLLLNGDQERGERLPHPRLSSCRQGRDFSALLGNRRLDLHGNPVEREAKGFHARVVQHEMDHLDGILYLDRMPDLSLLTFNEEVRYFPDDLSELAFRRGDAK